jgi:uncharacterized membrane protein
MINIVKKYLDLNHFSTVKEDFETYFLSHPNYPSLFAITDSLNLLSIDNIAVKMPKEQISELPDHFLANCAGNLVLVSKTDIDIVVETEKGEKLIQSRKEFLNLWDGIVLVIEPKAIEVKPKVSKRVKGLQYLLPILALTVVSIYNFGFDLQHLAFLCTSVLGFIVSVFIVQEKLGMQNEVIAKLCNMTVNTSCDSVIKSEKSQISKWLSFTDVSLLFFGTNLLAILLFPVCYFIIGLLSAVSIPVIGYTVWLQMVHLKKWCLLCLMISFIFVIQAVLFVLNFKTNFSGVSSIVSFYLMSAVLVTTIWFWIQSVLSAKIKTEKSILKLTKFKRNHEIFSYLSKEVQFQKGFDQLKGINFGSLNATVQLTLIISPSCIHCHNAFDEAFLLFKKHPERVFLNVLFNVNPENNDNRYKVIVGTLLVLSNLSQQKAQEALIDWHSHKIGLEKWKAKWDVTLTNEAIEEMSNQYLWCHQNEFNYTPVQIVNGKLLPNEYEVNELKYFLNDFTKEEFSPVIQSLVEA